MSSQHRYLLDTNIISDLVRQPRGTVARNITRVGESAVCTSVVVAAELRYGARKSNSSRLKERIDLILQAIDTLSLDTNVSPFYAEIRNHLYGRGQSIGGNDLFIAAHSLAENLILVTGNLKEFTKVPKLPVENWLT